MNLSWIHNRSLQMSTRARLVADEEAEALKKKLESITWTPENGFLKDRWIERLQARPIGQSRAA